MAEAHPPFTQVLVTFETQVPTALFLIVVRLDGFKPFCCYIGHLQALCLALPKRDVPLRPRPTRWKGVCGKAKSARCMTPIFCHGLQLPGSE